MRAQLLPGHHSHTAPHTTLSSVDMVTTDIIQLTAELRHINGIQMAGDKVFNPDTDIFSTSGKNKRKHSLLSASHAQWHRTTGPEPGSGETSQERSGGLPDRILTESESADQLLQTNANRWGVANVLRRVGRPGKHRFAG